MWDWKSRSKSSATANDAVPSLSLPGEPAGQSLAHTPFKADLQELLGFHGEFHWELLQHFADKAIDQERRCRLLIQTALAGIEELVFRQLGGRPVGRSRQLPEPTQVDDGGPGHVHDGIESLRHGSRAYAGKNQRGIQERRL